MKFNLIYAFTGDTGCSTGMTRETFETRNEAWDRINSLESDRNADTHVQFFLFEGGRLDTSGMQELNCEFAAVTTH